VSQFARFVINGLVASGVYFSILSLCIELLQFRSAAVAAVVASAIGIVVSYLGNRHFVFGSSDQPMRGQFFRFIALYGVVAAIHSGVLLVWSDYLGLDYRIGFLIATALQIAVTFVGNKRLVFRS
jgi:putative flippase GtrA